MEADGSNTKDSDKSWMREYAWEYFLAHGQARLTTFRFYLAFCTILSAGIFAILANSQRPIMAAPLGFILAFLSFVYSHVDRRHKQLIANAQKALIDIETQWELQAPDRAVHSLCLFTLDSMKKAVLKERSILKRKTLTYSTCVRLVFGVFGIGGLFLGIGVIIWQAL